MAPNKSDRTDRSVAFFCASPQDLGWADVPVEFEGVIQQLISAMIADAASRCSQKRSVYVCETADFSLGPWYTDGEQIHRVMQPESSLGQRMVEFASGYFRNGEHRSLVLVLRVNPLLEMDYLERVEGLVHQDEETIGIVFERPGDLIQLVAMRSFHPSVCLKYMEVQAQLQSLLEAEAVLSPVGPVRGFSGMNRLPFLLHEVERQVLLARPYPVKTYSILERMNQAGIFGRL